MQCSHAAKPFLNTFIYYFEVKINTLNPGRPGIVIGLTDEAFLLNKIPGSSKRSFGLRSDGKVYHGQSQILDYATKFLPNDIIGCGLCYISRKIFFTRNGIVLGKPFDLQESVAIFASASLSAPQDSITFSFTGPFIFNIDNLIAEENELMETEMNSEQIQTGDLYKLIRDYLEYQGYPETLKAFEEATNLSEYEKNTAKMRSYSGRISERYDSIDIDPTCQACQEAGKICKLCLKSLMENIEPSANIRLPEFKNRCESVDLSCFYLNDCKDDEVDDNCKTLNRKDVQVRGTLRKIVLKGNMKEVVDFLTENLPEMLSDEDCMLYIYIQEFINIIKSNEIYSALDFAREKLAKFKDCSVYYRSTTDSSIFV